MTTASKQQNSNGLIIQKCFRVSLKSIHFTKNFISSHWEAKTRLLYNLWNQRNVLQSWNARIDQGSTDGLLLGFLRVMASQYKRHPGPRFQGVFVEPWLTNTRDWLAEFLPRCDKFLPIKSIKYWTLGYPAVNGKTCILQSKSSLLGCSGVPEGENKRICPCQREQIL